MIGRMDEEWRAVRVRRSVAGRRLGDLEAELLRLLWKASEPVGARELMAELPGPARAYTTVVTVLNRMIGKGLVERIGDGRRFCYKAAGDRDLLTAKAIEDLLVQADDRRAVIAHLVGAAADPDIVRELQEVIERSVSGSLAAEPVEKTSTHETRVRETRVRETRARDKTPGKRGRS